MISNLRFSTDVAAAPKNGAVLALIIRGGDKPLFNVGKDEPIITFGFNLAENTGEDLWHVMGWNCSHDFITEHEDPVVLAWADIGMPLTDADQEIPKLAVRILSSQTSCAMTCRNYSAGKHAPHCPSLINK